MEARVLKDVPKAMAGIRAGLGVFGEKNLDSEWSKHWEDFRKQGGKTGWIDLHHNLEAEEKNLQKMVDRIKAGKAPKHVFRRFLDSVDDINAVIENAARLSAYKNAVDAGLTKKQAAALAKDLTVNFNRKGNMGPSMNALYMFYNASVQGSVRLLQAMAHSKKGRKLAAATIGFAVMVDLMNRALAGEDDDGENLYDALPDYVKDRNLILMGSDGPIVKIPLPWGYSVLHNIGQAIGKSMTGERFNVADEASRVALAALDSFNPVGSSTFLQTISPTIADPAVQIAENKNFAGNPLKPEQSPWGEPKPEYQMHWKSATENSKAVTEWLNRVSGGNTVRPGMIDLSPEWVDLMIDTVGGGMGRTVSNTWDTVEKVIDGKELQTERIPFVRKVTGHNSEYGVKARYYEWSSDVAYAKSERKHLKGKDLQEALKRPASKLVPLYTSTEKALRKLRRVRKGIVARGGDTAAIDRKIRARMSTFNKQYAERVLESR